MTDPGDILAVFSSELGMSPEQVLVAGLGIFILLLIIIVTFLGYFRILIHIAAFAFPVARVKAIGNPYIRPYDLEILSESKSLFELYGNMKEAGFPVPMKESTESPDIDTVLDRLHVGEYTRLEESVPDSIRPFFQAFHSFLEIEELKKAIRILHAGLSPDLLKQRMVPVGVISPEIIESLAQSPTVEEMISRVPQEPYGRVLGNALPEYQETRITFPLESALDVAAFKDIHRSVQRVDAVIAGPVREFCGVYTDIVNLLTLLRARSFGIGPEESSRLFFPGGAVYEEWRLRQLLELPGIIDIVQQISGTEYYEALHPALPGFELSGRLQDLEFVLEQFLLHKVLVLSSTYHLTGGPLIKFAIARQFEIRNIRIIAHSLQGIVPPESAMPRMVSEGAGS
jgi:V/A-type H+-transporting ATPase subunit C